MPVKPTYKSSIIDIAENRHLVGPDGSIIKSRSARKRGPGKPTLFIPIIYDAYLAEDWRDNTYEDPRASYTTLVYDGVGASRIDDVNLRSERPNWNPSSGSDANWIVSGGVLTKIFSPNNESLTTVDYNNVSIGPNLDTGQLAVWRLYATAFNTGTAINGPLQFQISGSGFETEIIIDFWNREFFTPGTFLLDVTSNTVTGSTVHRSKFNNPVGVYIDIELRQRKDGDMQLYLDGSAYGGWFTPSYMVTSWNTARIEDNYSAAKLDLSISSLAFYKVYESDLDY